MTFKIAALAGILLVAAVGFGVGHRDTEQTVWIAVTELACYKQLPDGVRQVVYSERFAQSEMAQLAMLDAEKNGLTCKTSLEWAQAKMDFRGVPPGVGLVGK